MKAVNVIILCNDIEIVQLSKDVAGDLGLEIICKPDLANFLIALQENYYQAAVLFCDDINPEILKWIKVIHKVQPKVPLILFSNQIDENFAGRIYEEGVFYMGIQPIHKKLFCEVLEAALTVSRSKVNP